MNRSKNRLCDEPFGGLDSIRYSEEKIAPEFVLFANSRILPMLRLDGYKLKEKQVVAIHCIHNLSLAALRKPPKVVADSRDNSRNGLRIAVWDAIIKAGLCRIWAEGIQGIPQQVQGGVTRYRATKTLLRLLTQYDQKKYIDLRLASNTDRKRPTFDAHVILHTGRTDLDTGERLPKEMQKQLIPLSTLDRRLIQYLRDQERWNAEYNAVMARHDWLMEPPGGIPYEPNPCLRWTHSGQHDDLANVVAGVCVGASKTKITVGFFSRGDKSRSGSLANRIAWCRAAQLQSGRR